MAQAQSHVSFSDLSRPEIVRWTGSIAAAAMLHAGALALVAGSWFAADAPAPTSPLAAMTAEIAPLPSAAQTQLNDTPPGPEQVEQTVQPQPVPDPPAFDPPPEATGNPPLDALAARKDTLPVQTKQTETVERTTAPVAAASKADDAAKAPTDAAPSDGKSAIQTWQSRLLAHLERNKRYPVQARLRRQEDTVYLKFVMDRTGKALSWRVWRSHGHALLDNEVNALIQRASPLPPPPDEMGGTTIEMMVPVEFYIHRG